VAENCILNRVTIVVCSLNVFIISGSKPQRNVVIYPPAMPNTHQLNFQPSLHSAYPGIIYSPGKYLGTYVYFT